MPPDSTGLGFVQSWTDYTALLESVLTSLAILAGGVWAYFHYFKGRTFHERLEPSITGEILDQQSYSLLRITLKVCNVGLSKIPILQEGSALRFFSLNSVMPESVTEAPWLRRRTFSIMEGHDWVEPGEVVYDEYLFALPERPVAMKAEVVLVSKKHRWVARAVITHAPGGHDA
jgi:hypothetical protein